MAVVRRVWLRLRDKMLFFAADGIIKGGADCIILSRWEFGHVIVSHTHKDGLTECPYDALRKNN